MPTSKNHANKDKNDSSVVSKALLNAAHRLGLKHKELSEIVGISTSKLSRINKNEAAVSRSGKEFDLALLFIRIYRSLDSITGGDDSVSASWIRNENKALHSSPIKRMKSLEGLVDVLHYLDSHRAVT